MLEEGNFSSALQGSSKTQTGMRQIKRRKSNLVMYVGNLHRHEIPKTGTKRHICYPELRRGEGKKGLGLQRKR